MQVENPTPRDKRVLKAHRKRYVEDKNLETIAQEMGYSYDTIRDYFRSDSTERIKRLYDEEEIEFLRLQLLNMADNARKNAESYVSRAVGHETTTASDLNRAAKEEQEIPKRYAEMLQELGIIDKPKERKEIEDNSGPAEINISMEKVEDGEEVEME